jgi:hypothetical protein
MGFKERERLAEEVHAHQPTLFFSVLAMRRFGAALEHIEVVLNLLLVFHEAMKASGRQLPLISEEVQQRCLTRISARARFNEGLRRGSKRAPARTPSPPTPNSRCSPTSSAPCAITTCSASSPKRRKCWCS